MRITASSELPELAQIPVTVFINGTPLHVLTFHGSNGKPQELTCDLVSYGHSSLYRLYVGGNGLKLLKMELTYKSSEVKMWF